jgi:hypothetical protein
LNFTLQLYIFKSQGVRGGGFLQLFIESAKVVIPLKKKYLSGVGSGVENAI